MRKVRKLYRNKLSLWAKKGATVFHRKFSRKQKVTWCKWAMHLRWHVRAGRLPKKHCEFCTERK